MYNPNKVKNPYAGQIAANVIYVIIALLITVSGVYALFQGVNGRVIYPIVFFLGAALNFADGLPRIFTSGRDKKKRAGGIALLALGIVLAVIAAVMARIVWR